MCLLLTTTTAAAAEEEAAADLNSDVSALEEEIMREAIAEGRGDRDEVGIRDQWESSEHLRGHFDVRRPPSFKVRQLLQTYRLECENCDHDEATSKVNSFVRDTKQEAQRRARNDVWQSRAVSVVLLIGAAAAFWFFASSRTYLGPEPRIDAPTRSWIEAQRLQAAKEKERHQRINAVSTPSWRDNEETELWSPRQEKQFVKALSEFGGMSPKERYHLIAQKVNDKSKLECQMHHKLQQAMAKDQ
jgi:hypothetical protein